MAVNCKITSNSQVIYPELPIERQDILIVDDRRQLNGTLRRAYRGVKKRMSYILTGATETERATWITAHPLNASYSHTDEQGTTRTVVTVARTDSLSRTQPAVEGGTNTTGPGFYDLSVEVEEV